MPADTQTLQYHYSALLRCVSPLHLGDGEQAETKDRPHGEAPRPSQGRYSTVCTDFEQTPYIPASTLRGALASRLLQSDPAICKELIGNQNQAGRLRVQHALLDRSASKPDESGRPYWDARRCTYLQQGVAIDPVTRTAGDRQLYGHELVPAGAAFVWHFSLERPSPQARELLESVLNDWQGQFDRAIGSGQGKGWGRMHLELYRPRTVTRDDLAAWLADADSDRLVPAPPKALKELKAEDLVRHGDDVETPAGDLRLLLLPRSPFLVNESGYTREGKEEAKVAFQRDAQGRALIPGSSLKGWLRQRAHRIAATILHQHLDEPAATAHQRAKPWIDELFGTEHRRSRVWTSDAVSTKPAEPFEFTLNAIDRFTGGVANNDSRHLRPDFCMVQLSLARDNKPGGFLFKVQAATTTQLKCDLQWDRRGGRDRPTPAQCGLLLLVARDLLEGELRLGWGQAKGLGEFAVRLQAGGERIDDWPALLGCLEQDHDPRGWVAELHRELAALPHPNEEEAA